MKPALAIGSAGFIATAVSFGPARMGFGLFAPAFRESFTLTTIQMGLIASLIFFGFLCSLPFSNLLSKRAGEKAPVMLGSIAAALGFLIAAHASSGIMLALGVALAGASAGLCWVPFNDAAEQAVPEDKCAGTLSAISTGTAMGVVLTSALFLWVLFGAPEWRLAWKIFVFISLVACVVTWLALPKGPAVGRTGAPGQAVFLSKEASPLYAAALCFGACNAVYLSFAADYVVQSGGLPGLRDQAAAAVIFIAYGLFGIAGLFAGKLERHVGIMKLLSMTFMAFTASLVMLALMPDIWFGLIVSAALHGAAVMMISAILAFWSLRLFPGNGSRGFTAALYAVALSGAAGPMLAGVLADSTSLTTALLATSLIPLSAAALFTRLSLNRLARHQEHPAT